MKKIVLSVLALVLVAGAAVAQAPRPAHPVHHKKKHHHHHKPVHHKKPVHH